MSKIENPNFDIEMQKNYTKFKFFKQLTIYTTSDR